MFAAHAELDPHPQAPQGWRRSADGGLHRLAAGWLITVKARSDGYGLYLTRTERTVEDALAIAEEIATP